MTQWREPDPARQDPAAAPDDASLPPGPGRVAPKQRLLIAIAVAALAAGAVGIALVLLLGGSGRSGPAKGSPEAFTDQVAAALQARSTQRLEALSCPAAATAVLRSARDLLARPVHADRQGSVQVRDNLAVARIRVRSDGRPDVVATIALQHATAAWCLQLLSPAAPRS